MKTYHRYAEIVLPTLFLIFSCWYLVDAYKASASIGNLILILPAGLVVILLCLWIIFSGLKELIKEKHEKKENKTIEKKKVSVFHAMLIFSGYVFCMEPLGFDLATFFFMTAFIAIQGERRPVRLIFFPLLFSILISLFFKYMVPYPMPMMLDNLFSASI